MRKERIFVHQCPKLEERFERDSLDPYVWDPDYAFLQGRHCSFCRGDLLVERLNAECDRLRREVERAVQAAGGQR